MRLSMTIHTISMVVFWRKNYYILTHFQFMTRLFKKKKKNQRKKLKKIMHICLSLSSNYFSGNISYRLLMDETNGLLQ